MRLAVAVWRLLRRRWPALYGVSLGAALTQTGWIRSAREGRCVDADGRPIPWLTYPAISLLSQRVQPQFRVFEYGSGSSTLWWAARAASITSVDHDPTWASSTREAAPSNVSVLMRPLSDGYVEAIAQGPETFHIVVIDGRRRVDCSRFATKFLTPDGVVVWDNSDRPKYQPGLDEMVAAGFRRLDLVGLTPLTNEVLTTSILYRDGNCLDL